MILQERKITPTLATEINDVDSTLNRYRNDKPGTTKDAFVDKMCQPSVDRDDFLRTENVKLSLNENFLKQKI